MSSFKGHGRGSARPVVPLLTSFRPTSAAELVRAHPGTAHALFRSTPEERKTRWVLERKDLLAPPAPPKADLLTLASSKADVTDGADSVEQVLLSMSTADSLRKVLLAGADKPVAQTDVDPIASMVAEIVAEGGTGLGDGAAPVEVTGADMDRAMSALAVEAVVPRHLFMTSPPGIGKTTIVQKLLAKLIAEEGEGGIHVQGFFTEEVRDSMKQRCGFDLVSVGIVPSGRDPPRCPLARVGVAAPKVGKYTVDVQAFEDFALPLLKPPRPYELPDNPRLFTPEGGAEVVVGLVEELPVEEDDQTAAPRCIVTLPSTGEELTIDASTLSPVPEGWRPACEAAENDRPRLFICDEAGKMELMSLKFGPAIVDALNAGGSRKSPPSCVFGTLPQPAKGQRDHELVDTIRHRRDVRVVRMTRNNRDELVDKTYAMLREGLGLGPPGTGVFVAGQKRLTEDEIAAQEQEILRQHEEEKVRKKIAEAEEEQRTLTAAEEDKKDEKKKKKKKKELTPQEAQARIDARKRKRAQALQEGGPVTLDSDEERDAASVAVNGEAKGKVSTVTSIPAVATIDITDSGKKRALGVRDRDASALGISPAGGICIDYSKTVPAVATTQIVDTVDKSNSGVAVTQVVVPGNGKLVQAPACVDPAVATLEVVDSAEAAAARRARRDAKRRAAAAAQAAEESVVLLE